MKPHEAYERIEQLERRARELEMRPLQTYPVYIPQPYYWPTYPAWSQPYYPSWPTITCGAGAIGGASGIASN